MQYTRPELTEEEKAKSKSEAQALFRKYGIQGIVLAVAGLCFENRRLVKEINEHRAARGIDPLQTFEV
jgi:hypothetical protein